MQTPKQEDFYCFDCHRRGDAIYADYAFTGKSDCSTNTFDHAMASKVKIPVIEQQKLLIGWYKDAMAKFNAKQSTVAPAGGLNTIPAGSKPLDPQEFYINTADYLKYIKPRKPAPKCECGAAKVFNAKNYAPGHSDYCPVKKV